MPDYRRAWQTKQEVRQVWVMVAEHQEVLLTAWRNIHGNLDN